MQLNQQQREIVLKVVYYGPPLSGKTTNLEAIHKLLNKDTSGRLTVLNTSDDRTLFFDVLPINIKTEAGYRIKLKLFTVPGQVIHAATRRLVLSGADGVVFVADSQKAQSKQNNEFWRGMRGYLKESGFEPDKIPTVVQFNKRDLPDVRSDEEIEELRKNSPEPIYTAVAVRGDGVAETLQGLLRLVFIHLNQEYDFQKRFGIGADDFVKAVFAESGGEAGS